jgi:delta1-piperideine-2-carboxylate reductase
MHKTINLSLSDIFELSVDALLASGANRENAEAVAAVVRNADRDGCTSHGIFRVPGYCSALKL